jgi:hypothetical protein
MSDSLYLSQEIVEWLSQKKSEFLAWLIGNMPSHDIPIETYHSYDGEIENTILHPQYHYSYDWCDQKLSVFARHDTKNALWFVLISVEITTNQDTVFYPLIFIPTKSKEWISTWFQGESLIKTNLH